MKFVSHGALMINRGTRILFVFHLYSCGKHNLSTTLLANVVNLAQGNTAAKRNAHEHKI